ncbi:MAG: hypothetical protein OXI59_12435 [Gemmatimonadota bacterium]|nr:hypothetical protein [Gemmatimonadota bacterium]
MKKSICVLPILFAILLNPAYGQNKKPVTAIGPIDIAARNISCEGWDRSNCNEDLSVGFRQMLETAISKTRKMDLMERRRLDVMLTEQTLGQIGYTDTGGAIGGLTGVDYYVYGTITSFGKDVNATVIDGNSGIGGLFGGTANKVLGSGIATAKTQVQMGVDLKVSEVATGKILIADSLTEKLKTGTAFSFGGISQVDTEGDPFSDVQRVLAARIAEEIVTTLIPIKVIKVQKDGVLILNYGDIFLKPGQQLVAFEVGESFVDPDTGEVLGSEEMEIGRVEITRAEAKFSRAVVVGEQFSAQGTNLRKIKSQPKKQETQKSSTTFWNEK